MMNSGKLVYGMNRGSVGFLMNRHSIDHLPDRIATAVQNICRPLEMHTTDAAGNRREALAINEVYLFRQSYQAAKLRVVIDGRTRLEELICDGLLLATPAGSTAYNLSAHGPILPLEAPLLALTPVSPFRPRRWRGALLPNHVTVEIEILEPEKRPVNAVADYTEVKSVTSVRVAESENSTAIILSDPDHSWSERILTEQFQY
jgi:NAD+ kinase